MEAFGGREFENRGRVGACFGLDPIPLDSGESEHEQGISKTGSNWLRHLAIQVAWNWNGYQPDSYLTRWMMKKFDMDEDDDRKLGITALERKLMIHLSNWARDPEAEKSWGATFNKEE